MSQDKKNEGMRIDTDLIRQLANWRSAIDLNKWEFEYSGGNSARKRFRGYSPRPVIQVSAAAPAPARAAAAAPVAEAPADAAAHPGTVKSPMVGTVYLSGEPGS